MTDSLNRFQLTEPDILAKKQSITMKFGASMCLYQQIGLPAKVSQKSLLQATPLKRWLRTTKPSAWSARFGEGLRSTIQERNAPNVTIILTTKKG